MAAVAYSVLIAVCGGFEVLAAAFVFSLGMVALARLKTGLLLKRWILVNGFMLMLWLVLPFTGGGEDLYRLGGVGISREGVCLAATITLKSNAIILSLMALLSTMSFVTLGQALHGLRVPRKLVNLFILTCRYIFVLEQEYSKIMRAVKIRGFVPRTSLHTYKTYAYIVGMLFVRASERAERVYNAMCCRGFKGRFYSLVEFRASAGNWLFAAVMIMVMIGLAVLEWGAVYG